MGVYWRIDLCEMSLHSALMSSIGHNKGPALEAGFGWRKHCWTQARRDLVGTKVPLEIVRIRVKRAKALGLSYPQYASVLLGSGRDIVGFLFTVDGLQLRLRKRLEIPSEVNSKLTRIEACQLLSLAPSGENPDAFLVELNAVSDAPFVSSAAEPKPDGSWSESQRAIREALMPMKLPPKAVVMIGARESEAAWANAGKLAKFIPSDQFFEQPVAG